MKKKSNSSQLQAELVQLYRKALLQGMPLDELEAKINHYQTRLNSTEKVEEKFDGDWIKKEKNKVPKSVRYVAFLLPIFFVTVGLYLLGSAVFPILSYYVSTAPSLHADSLTAPIPNEDVMAVNPQIITQVSGYGEENIEEELYTGPTFMDAELDFTNLSNWFDASVSNTLANGENIGEEIYSIDIPSLNIKNAEVTVGGTDLNKSLIAYPGTALPGELGAPVIFGHSVLRQFYNPSEKNTRRYNSIFSTIMTLKPGEKIYVTMNDVKYTYVVRDKTEVKPTDVHILSQNYDSKLLKLVTCTPEGTYLRRGVITAVLVPGVTE